MMSRDILQLCRHIDFQRQRMISTRVSIDVEILPAVSRLVIHRGINQIIPIQYRGGEGWSPSLPRKMIHSYPPTETAMRSLDQDEKCY